MDESAYVEGEFEKYDKYEAEDFMFGKMNNGSMFEMSEVITKEKEIGDTSKDKYKTVFNGLIAKVQTPKPFNSCLYVRKDIKDKSFLVRVFSGKLAFDDLRIKLDPKEFEEMFDVYTDNKEVILKLFTPEIKQMLMEFKTKMKTEFEITMKNDYMYIRFWCGKMFEVAKLSKYSLDKDNLYNYYKMLVFIFELTNKLVDLLNNI